MKTYKALRTYITVKRNVKRAGLEYVVEDITKGICMSAIVLTISYIVSNVIILCI